MELVFACLFIEMLIKSRNENESRTYKKVSCILADAFSVLFWDMNM